MAPFAFNNLGSWRLEPCTNIVYRGSAGTARQIARHGAMLQVGQEGNKTHVCLGVLE